MMRYLLLVALLASCGSEAPPKPERRVDWEGTYDLLQEKWRREEAEADRAKMRELEKRLDRMEEDSRPGMFDPGYGGLNR